MGGMQLKDDARSRSSTSFNPENIARPFSCAPRFDPLNKALPEPLLYTTRDERLVDPSECSTLPIPPPFSTSTKSNVTGPYHAAQRPALTHEQTLRMAARHVPTSALVPSAFQKEPSPYKKSCFA